MFNIFLMFRNIVRLPRREQTTQVLNKPSTKLLREYNGMMTTYHLRQTPPVLVYIIYISYQRSHHRVQCCCLSLSSVL